MSFLKSFFFLNQSLSHLKVFLQLARTPICLRYRFPLGFFLVVVAPFMRKVCAVGGLARHLENWQGIAKSFPCLGMTSLQPTSVIFRAYIKGSRPLGFVDFTTGMGRRLSGWKEPFWTQQHEMLSRWSHLHILVKTHWVLCSTIVLRNYYSIKKRHKNKVFFQHNTCGKMMPPQTFFIYIFF